jgi:hypothetical protein
MVISGLRPANCNLKIACLTGLDAEVLTREPPKRVRAPSVVSSLTGLVVKESCTLIRVH